MTPREVARNDLDETRRIAPVRGRIIPITRSVALEIENQHRLERQFDEWHFSRIDLPAYELVTKRSPWRAFVAWLRGGRP